jgi:serine/threonine protein kinase
MRKLAGRPRLQAVSWLAPECFRGDGLSKHSDVYAFGILMWELYTGQVGTHRLVHYVRRVRQRVPTFSLGAPCTELQAIPTTILTADLTCMARDSSSLQQSSIFQQFP